MKFKSIRERDEHRELSRRALIGWMTAAGAALSVPLWKTWEVMEKHHGKAVAQGASCLSSNRYVDTTHGGGSQAWISQVYAIPDVAANASQATHSYFFQGNRGVAVPGIEREAWISPAAQRIYDALPSPTFYPTKFLGGRNLTHTRQPADPVMSSQGNTTMAVSEVLHTQASNPRLLSGVSVNNALYGTAPGANPMTTVGNSDGIVDLFDNASNQVGAVLDDARNADLYKQTTDALYSLNRINGRASTQSAFEVGRGAGTLIGKKLAELLRPTFADMERYGLNGGVNGDQGLRGSMQSLGKFFIITAKMFANGLTDQALWEGNAGDGDPHGGYGNMQSGMDQSMQIGYMYGAFIEDLLANDPYCDGEPIIAQTVMVTKGDTWKDVDNRNTQNWADGTPGGSGMVDVLGAGWLPQGTLGEITLGGAYTGFNPITGDLDNNINANQLGTSIAGAINYAVSGGDRRGAEQFGMVPDYVKANLTGE